MQNPLLQSWGLALIICLPVLSLLAVPGREFGLDWPGHLWMTAYFGEYFRHHLAFPEVLNTDWISGMPYPVFYGFLFYPFAGLLSIPLGADGAMRLILGSVLVLQCFQIRRLVESAGGSRWLAWLVAGLFCWSTYFLTNLYNRSALPEFIALALLTCALSCFLRVTMARFQGASSRALKVESFFFYVLCAGVHPLTAIFGALLIAVLMLVALPFQPRHNLSSTVRWGALGVMATAVVLSPWLYATGQFHRDLALHQDTMTAAVHFSDSIDRWDVRLSPWPRDVRMEQGKTLEAAATPYLEAQVNVPLLVLALVLSLALIRLRLDGSLKGERLEWSIWGGSLAVFGVALVASVVPAFFRLLPGFFHSLQFAYRLVAYQNLALLGIITGALGLLRMSSRPSSGVWQRSSLQIGLAVWGAVGLMVKLIHGGTVMHEIGPDGQAWRQNPDRLVHLPQEFYGWPAYSVPDTDTPARQPSQEVFLPVGTGREFGKGAPLALDLDRPGMVLFQLQPFPWSQLVVNGEPVEDGQFRKFRQGYAVELPPGVHEISWRWHPDPVWSWLGLLSLAGLAGWGLVGVRLRFRAS